MKGKGEKLVDSFNDVAIIVENNHSSTIHQFFQSCHLPYQSFHVKLIGHQQFTIRTICVGLTFDRLLIL